MIYGLLNISADPELRNFRQQVLEDDGYQVLSPHNIVEVEQACKQQRFDAVILGHAIPALEKRRITCTIRDLCSLRTPVLGIYAVSHEEVADADLAIPADEPHALLEGLRKLLNIAGPRREPRKFA
jgi:DNA-binding response OmpR family regulator